MSWTKHSTPEHKAIAETRTILRCQVGSGVHGTAIAGTDDRDEMGICLEPPDYVIGLRRFDQYVYRTQPEGVRYAWSVLPDGETPFTSERRLPGTRPPDRLGSIAAAQVDGVLAAIADVPPREARQWGVPGDGLVLQAPGLTLLAEGPRLTGLTGWRLVLGSGHPGR